MDSEPIELFHDPLAEVPPPGGHATSRQQPRLPRNRARETTRGYANTAAARAASLEAVVRDLRKLELRTASRGIPR